MIENILHKLRLVVVGVVFAGLASVVVAASFSPPAAAQDAARSAVCSGIGAATGSNGNCEDPGGSAGIDNTIQTVIDILSLVVGVIAVIMLIVGGLRYVTSSGDSGSTAAARNTIIYALVGLAIVALAQIIVRFTVGQTSGVV